MNHEEPKCNGVSHSLYSKHVPDALKDEERQNRVCAELWGEAMSRRTGSGQRERTYPSPAHAEALVESVRALVYHNLPYAVERALVSVCLVVHESYLDDICPQESGWPYQHSALNLTYQQDWK